MKEKSSPWIKIISLNPPSLQDNTADADRLIAALKTDLQTDHVDVDLDLLKKLPDLLRKWDYRARCIVFKDRRRWLLTGITDAADTGRSQVHSQGGTQAAGPNEQHAGRLQFKLPCHAHFGHDQVAAISLDFLIGQGYRFGRDKIPCTNAHMTFSICWASLSVAVSP